ncbi:hypothetical protein Zmor_024300 [Zophobas morio]|uniref:Ricin B lectin domain-containing protein n=1 Tax=Zophobas morio TaxID=2755281 RepID=A0AA38I0C6_9CUCU|nr:hypothetical protein Zmor_024300 [Zophobas morio]
MSTTTYSHNKEDYFVIRNPHSGLVLDASEDFITLQEFTGFSTQKWRLEPTKDGSFYIINKSTEKVLDIDYRYSIKNSWVVVSHKIDDYYVNCRFNNGTITPAAKTIHACQKWFVQYGSYIINACDYYVVEIKNEVYKSGVYLETGAVDWKANERFKLQYI